jgi:hypothetical protein
MGKTIAQIKAEMKSWKDLYGGDIMYTDEIDAADSKRELNDIINKYSHHLEDMACDAQSHLERFRKRLRLSSI